MVFSSIPFLYYFLPCVLILYFIVPKSMRNLTLLLTSIVFYAWGEPKFLTVMLFTALQGYLFGILIERYRIMLDMWAKICLAVSSIISLGLLGYFKYADFFIANFNAVTGMSLPLLKVVLPIGISFYTFQILSYIADIYRGNVSAQHNFIDFAAYIAMFPQLIAGPIVRYSDISAQLKNRTHCISKCALGIRRFVLGLGKKVIFANTLGELCSAFKESDDKSVLFFWIYAAACALQIYFDFSGYSDMAIGLGKIFGFDFMENFNYPFISKSITEFWRRWHISLGSWFRDYVYIPLGGNRAGKLRWLCNIMIVWLLTGFWHGANWNFIIWGIIFGILLIIEKLCFLKVLEKEKKGFISHVYVSFAVLLSFVIFDAADISQAWFNIKSMFGAGGLTLVSVESLYYLKSYAVILAAAAIGATPLITNGIKKLAERDRFAKVISAAEPAFLLIVLIVITSYIIDGSFNPFLYFRF